MMMKTPNFKSKSASIMWMLLLALVLILVDYYLSPVVIVAKNSWQFITLENFDKVLSNDQLCPKNLLKYKQNFSQKEYNAQACFKDGRLILIKESNYKGVLSIYKHANIEQIAVNLQQPVVQFIGLDNEVYIYEKGRDRLLKFWQK